MGECKIVHSISHSCRDRMASVVFSDLMTTSKDSVSIGPLLFTSNGQGALGDSP